MKEIALDSTDIIHFCDIKFSFTESYLTPILVRKCFVKAYVHESVTNFAYLTHQ